MKYIISVLCVLLIVGAIVLLNLPEEKEALASSPQIYQLTHTPHCGRGAAVCADCAAEEVTICPEQNLNWKIGIDHTKQELFWYWEAYGSGCDGSKYIPEFSGSMGATGPDGGSIPSLGMILESIGAIEGATMSTWIDPSSSLNQGGKILSGYSQFKLLYQMGGVTPYLFVKTNMLHIECDECNPPEVFMRVVVKWEDMHHYGTPNP